MTIVRHVSLSQVTSRSSTYIVKYSRCRLYHPIIDNAGDKDSLDCKNKNSMKMGFRIMRVESIHLFSLDPGCMPSSYVSRN